MKSIGYSSTGYTCNIAECYRCRWVVVLVACMPSTAELCTGSTVSHVNNAGLNGKKKSQCLPVARQGGAAHGARPRSAAQGGAAAAQRMFCGHRQGDAEQGVQYIVQACALYHARGIEYNECKNALMRPAGNQRFPGPGVDERTCRLTKRRNGCGRSSAARVYEADIYD